MKAFEDVLKQGGGRGVIKAAMKAAGYSDSVAKNGLSVARKNTVLRKILTKMENKLIDQGFNYLSMPDRMHALAVGRVVQATIDGEEKGVNAARTLGSHRLVQAFTPANQVNVFTNIGALEGLITLPKEETNADVE